MRVWGGRFGEANDERVAAFTRSIDVDRELAADDLAGSIAHVRGLARAGLITEDELATLVEGLNGLAEDVAAGSDRVGPGPRGRPPEPRSGPDGTRRAGGRQAPHGPLTERPGRHGSPVVDCAARSTGSMPASSRSSARSSAWPNARATRCCPARPTSSPPSRCCSRTTCSPTSRWPSATAAGLPTPGGGSTSRRWAPAPSREPATRSTARRPRAELGFDGVTANSLDAVSDRDFVVEVLAAVALGDGPPQPAGGGAHLVVEPAVRVRAGLGRVLDRQLDHAQQEEPGSRRARPWPRRPRRSQR